MYTTNEQSRITSFFLSNKVSLSLSLSLGGVKVVGVSPRLASRFCED